jgi:hypothetical protein
MSGNCYSGKNVKSSGDGDCGAVGPWVQGRGREDVGGILRLLWAPVAAP